MVFLFSTFSSFAQQKDTITQKTENQLEEVVISGTLKAVKRLENPVPVEVITATFLKQNPTSNVFDALQNVNGLRPQNNCNVCNTGDIRINGLDGPYTMVTIDGMPIVSALGSVYGLSGIPNSIIEKIEVVKGAASTLYGSEAVGGLINIITKRPKAVPQFTADIFSTSWLENNIDLGYRTSLGKKADALIGALNRGRPGLAAVDVFEAEPILQGHPLLRLENAICTPHIGYVEQESYELYFSAAFDNVVNFIKGTPTNIVNPGALQVRR